MTDRDLARRMADFRGLSSADDAGAVIDRMGGTAAVARFFGISMPAVSDWRKTGLPKARLRHLRDVRPDVLSPGAAATDPPASQANAAGRIDRSCLRLGCCHGSDQAPGISGCRGLPGGADAPPGFFVQG